MSLSDEGKNRLVKDFEQKGRDGAMVQASA